MHAGRRGVWLRYSRFLKDNEAYNTLSLTLSHMYIQIAATAVTDYQIAERDRLFSVLIIILSLDIIKSNFNDSFERDEQKIDSLPVVAASL